jgi:hypothetical protein
MTTEELNQIERLVAILSLGLCSAIKHEVINIDEAEHILYSPFTIKKLTEIGSHQEIIELIHAGTELEDLASLLPKELSKTLSQIEGKTLKLLSTSSKTNPQLEKWLSQYLKEKSVSHFREPLQRVA